MLELAETAQRVESFLLSKVFTGPGVDRKMVARVVSGLMANGATNEAAIMNWIERSEKLGRKAQHDNPESRVAAYLNDQEIAESMANRYKR
jgi:hypothetical protein